MDHVNRVDWTVTGLTVELPSWGFANSGTRFRVFPQPGVPHMTMEKIDDAATIAQFTGVARRISLHILWDRVDDVRVLAAYAADRRLTICGINSNTTPRFGIRRSHSIRRPPSVIAHH